MDSEVKNEWNHDMKEDPIDVDMQHQNYYNSHFTLSELDPAKLSVENKTDTRDGPDQNNSNEQNQGRKEPVRHPSTLQEGRIVYPIEFDIFDEESDTLQKNLGKPVIQAFQVDIPKSSGGKLHAQFGSQFVIHKDKKIGASSNHLKLGYDITKRVNVDCFMETGPRSKVSIEPYYQSRDKQTLISCHFNVPTYHNSTTMKPQTIFSPNKINSSLQVQHFFSKRNILGNMTIGDAFQQQYSHLAISNVNHHKSHNSTFFSMPEWTINLYVGKYYSPPWKSFFNVENSVRSFKSESTIMKKISIPMLPSPLLSFSTLHTLSSPSISSQSTRKARLEWGINPNSRKLYWEALLSHIYSKQYHFSIGIRHVTFQGLTWLFHYQYGSLSFSVPIHLCSAISKHTPYPWKICIMGFLTTYLEYLFVRIWDRISGIEDANFLTPEEAQLRKEESLLFLEKAKQDAEKQVLLMKRQAKSKTRIEKEKQGLIIVKGYYGITSSPSNQDIKEEDLTNGLDVTIQLQFWVHQSKLILPATSKAQMLGFYDVTQEFLELSENEVKKDDLVSEAEGTTTPWYNKLWKGIQAKSRDLVKENDVHSSKSKAILFVRYQMGGVVYEQVIQDDEPLTLPCSNSKVMEK